MIAISLLPPETGIACPCCGRTDAVPPRGGVARSCVCEAHDEALEGLVSRAIAADPEGRDHPRRVGRIAAILARSLGFEAGQQEMLERAAALHDIGKMSLPDGVLGHRHVLDPAARRLMERHTLLGASILSHARADWMRLAASIALSHHERWDGTGYPFAMAGTDIPIGARIVAVADVYDALRSERPYKDAQHHDEALTRILEGDARIQPAQFDPQVLAALQHEAEAVATALR